MKQYLCFSEAQQDSNIGHYYLNTNKLSKIIATWISKNYYLLF